MAIAHAEKDVAVLDLVREFAAVHPFASLCRICFGPEGLRRHTHSRRKWGREFVRERFRDCGSHSNLPSGQRAICILNCCLF